MRTGVSNFAVAVPNQVRGGTLLDGKLEEYEAAWQAAGGTRITSQSLGDLFARLGQPLDAPRLAQVPRSFRCTCRLDAGARAACMHRLSPTKTLCMHACASGLPKHASRR
jgi:hypothetical protein